MEKIKIKGTATGVFTPKAKKEKQEKKESNKK